MWEILRVRPEPCYDDVNDDLHKLAYLPEFMPVVIYVRQELDFRAQALLLRGARSLTSGLPNPISFQPIMVCEQQRLVDT